MVGKFQALLLLAPLTLASCVTPANAQGSQSEAPDESSNPGAKASGKEAPSDAFSERLSTTQGKVRIGNNTIRYRADAGTLPFHGSDDKPDAEMFYVAYTREGVKDTSSRPITFVFNGGPGSSAVWLHLGTFGPRRVAFEDATHPTPPPYPIVDNAYSILDQTDLVFIDPVGTGYSRTVDDGENSAFHGVEQDLRSVGEFIRLYTTRNARWNSPKFLAGESYGTTRAAGLVQQLQSDGMFFNGVVLISAVLDFQTISFSGNNDLSYILYLPTYTATAAYHKQISLPAGGLEALMDSARKFARGEYAAALMQGAQLPAEKRRSIAKHISSITGLSEEFVLQHNLRISPSVFRKELVRSSGHSVGRLDSRYIGIDATAGGAYPDTDPSYSAIQGPYTAAMNHYLKTELKATVDHRYEILSGTVNRNWSWPSSGRSGYTDVASDLAQAMRTNPHLQVYVANGYYDLATPFFATEYTNDHLAVPTGLRSNVQMSYFEAGHMMYLHEASLKKLKDDLHLFFERAKTKQRRK